MSRISLFKAAACPWLHEHFHSGRGHRPCRYTPLTRRESRGKDDRCHAERVRSSTPRAHRAAPSAGAARDLGADLIQAEWLGRGDDPRGPARPGDEQPPSPRRNRNKARHRGDLLQKPEGAQPASRLSPPRRRHHRDFLPGVGRPAGARIRGRRSAVNPRGGRLGHRPGHTPAPSAAVPNPRIQVAYRRSTARLMVMNMHRDEQDGALGQRVVALVDRPEHQAADPGQREDLLDDHRARRAGCPPGARPPSPPGSARS